MRSNAKVAIAALLAAAVIYAGPALAQSSGQAGEIAALKSEIEALKAGQAEILGELKDLTGMIRAATGQQQQQQAFEPTELSLAGAPFLGDVDAPVTLIEFSDYQCPFCQRHYMTTMNELKERFVDEGKIKYVMKEFPIETIHPMAAKASEAALCAGDQNRYWQMHDMIFDNPERLQVADFIDHAGEIGMDEDALAGCLEEGKYTQTVQADMVLGAELGVRGTPSFFVAITDPQDPEKVKAVEFIRGAVPFARFDQAIQSALTQAGES